MDADFSAWLLAEMEYREWNNTDLARRAGVVPSTISMIASGQQRVGMRSAIGIAKAFGIPADVVLQKAGLSPKAPPVDNEQELVDILRRLPTTIVGSIFTLFRALAFEHIVPSMSDYDLTGEERQLLDDFRLLPPEFQEFALQQVANMRRLATRPEVTVIGDEDSEDPTEAQDTAA